MGRGRAVVEVGANERRTTRSNEKRHGAEHDEGFAGHVTDVLAPGSEPVKREFPIFEVNDHLDRWTPWTALVAPNSASARKWTRGSSRRPSDAHPKFRQHSLAGEYEGNPRQRRRSRRSLGQRLGPRCFFLGGSVPGCFFRGRASGCFVSGNLRRLGLSAGINRVLSSRRVVPCARCGGRASSRASRRGSSRRTDARSRESRSRVGRERS